MLGTRQGLTSQVWKPLKGSEQERHRIGSLWLLLESGLRGKNRIRDQSGGYSGGAGDRWLVAVVMENR